MINEIVNLNSYQQISVINNPKNEVNIAGRATGKSFIMGWEMNQIIRRMPRSITAITGQTYGQMLTRTLPSTLKFLEQIGYEKDKDYVINKMPPAGWEKPYETVTKFDNFISFRNGTGFLLLSQDRTGSSRGPNIDREIVDEALTLNKKQYDQEVSPTNRGNEEHFGFRSANPIKQHHGFRYVSSMPYTQDQRWLLEFGNYYQEEAGIMVFDIWNRIIKLQMELITAAISNNPRLFKEIWNEVKRLKQKIVPFTSRDGLLFTLANAFDNIENIGMSYIVREYNKLPSMIFMIEIMNWIIDKVENCYYKLDSMKHIYYDASNDAFIRSYAEQNNYDYKKLEKLDSRFDLDCDPTKPLEICPDWGAKINLFSVGQERYYNFATKIIERTDCTINEFYVKRDESSSVEINDLVNMFCEYYEHHSCKEVIYFRDRYGDHRQPNVKNSKSYNEQAIDQFIKNKWRVIQKVHRGMEPPQHEKYLWWSNALQGSDPRYPKPIFNGKNCKYTIISMNNTKVIDKNGKFEKDKSSERKNNILPEEATHFGDAVDKRYWSKYGILINKRSTFVDPRIGN